MTEKRTAIILPSWNPDEPRFIVENCEYHIAEDREFRNNTCVYNQRLGFAYSVEEIVEVLNNMGDKIDDLEDDKEQLHKRITQLSADLASLKSRNAVLKGELNKLKGEKKQDGLATKGI